MANTVDGIEIRHPVDMENPIFSYGFILFHVVQDFFHQQEGDEHCTKKIFFEIKTNESCVFLRLCDVLLTSAFNFLFVVPVKTKR